MKLTKNPLALSLAAVLALMAANFARGGEDPAPSPVLPGRPDAAPTTNESADGSGVLGPKFSSLSAGIELRPPAGLKEVARNNADEIVRYSSEAKKWDLVVARQSFSKPVPMDLTKDATGIVRQGMLSLTAERFKIETPGAEILRTDMINLGEHTVGMIAARYSGQSETRLMQEAIVHASDQLYYTLIFTAPVAKDVALDEDAAAREAVSVFSQVLDSTKLLDQSQVQEDVMNRLFMSKALYVNLTPQKIK